MQVCNAYIYTILDVLWQNVSIDIIYHRKVRTDIIITSLSKTNCSLLFLTSQTIWSFKTLNHTKGSERAIAGFSRSYRSTCVPWWRVFFCRGTIHSLCPHWWWSSVYSFGGAWGIGLAAVVAESTTAYDHTDEYDRTNTSTRISCDVCRKHNSIWPHRWIERQQPKIIKPAILKHETNWKPQEVLSIDNKIPLLSMVWGKPKHAQTHVKACVLWIFRWRSLSSYPHSIDYNYASRRSRRRDTVKLTQRRLDTITCTTFFAELAQKLTNEFYVNF